MFTFCDCAVSCNKKRRIFYGFNLLYFVQFTMAVFALVILQVTGLSARAEDLSENPKRPHLVLDAESGEILSHELAFARWAPASLTKMMTAYTVFRALELQSISMKSPVRISEEAISQPPSKMGFPVGTILNIETALKIIMVKSANDISVALGEATSGSEAQFVALMNAHARRLGMIDSHFTNPHGLHDEGQYTSARDMALLTLQLTKEFPQYAEFFNIPALRFGRRRLRNHNALVRLFDGTNGMKTGYVCASGYNVAVRTTRNEKTLIAIVLGEKSSFRRNIKAARLLKDGFESGHKNTLDFKSFTDTSFNSKDPYDITKSICPRKYAALGSPKVRPPDAPSPQDFDGIDTQIIVPEGGFPVASIDLANPPFPQKKPMVVGNAITAHITTGNETATEVVEQSADEIVKKAIELSSLSAKQQSEIYFQPVDNLREDVRIELGGGDGPNPFGIKHTQGNLYQPPIPVPIKRPALDSESPSE